MPTPYGDEISQIRYLLPFGFAISKAKVCVAVRARSTLTVCVFLHNKSLKLTKYLHKMGTHFMLCLLAKRLQRTHFCTVRGVPISHSV